MSRNPSPPEGFAWDEDESVWMYRGHAVRRMMPDTGSYEILLVRSSGWFLAGIAKTLDEAREKVDRRLP